MVSVVITIIVVIILASVVITDSSQSIYQAGDSKMKQQITEVKKGIDTVRLANAKSGKTDEDTINAGFIKVRVVDPPETFVSFDEDQLTGYAVDLSTIDYEKLEIGRGYMSLMKGDIVTFDEDDVFVYDGAGKVFYAKGYQVGDGDPTYTGEDEDRKDPPKIEVISTVMGVIKLKVTPVYGGEISSVTVGTQKATTNDGLNFETTVNKNGSYKVIATEEGGNSGVLMVDVADIDETASAFTDLKEVYINEKEKYTNKQLAVLHVDAENAEYMSISQNGLNTPSATDLAKWRAYESSTNITLKEGLNQVYVWCKNVDNVPTSYKFAEITLDSIAPTRDAPSYVINGFQILMTCNQRDETSEDLTVKYGYKRVDETEYKWQDSQIIVDVDPGAKYMLITQATDAAGNTSESRSVTTEEVMSLPDNINITATPATGWTTRVQVAIEYPDTYGVSPYENLYRVDGGEWKKATSNRVSMTVIKNSKIEAVVSAKLNGQDTKMGKIKVLNVRNIDRVDPYIHDFETVEGYVQSGYDFTAKVYDKESGLVAWTVTNSKEVPTTWSNEFETTTETVAISYRVNENGIYYIWAKDAGGNFGYMGVEVTNIDLFNPIITSYEITYGNAEATLTAKAIDEKLGLAAYAFVKGENKTPTESDWIPIAQTTSSYTMTSKVGFNQNDYYSIWVKDVSGRTAYVQKYVKTTYWLIYEWYDIDENAEKTTTTESWLSVGCNTSVDLSKTATRNYSQFIGWNTDPNATVKIDSLGIGDETTGQEDVKIYAVFKYIDTIAFSKSNNNLTYELNLTITKSTPFTTLQYSYDGTTWTNYSSPLYITKNLSVFARTVYNNETISENRIDISNICMSHTFSDATCTADSVCTKCSKFNGAALGHSMGSYYVTVAATCTTTGTERRDCSRINQCGKYETRATDALGHSMGSYYITSYATCTGTGTKQSDCSRCSHYTTTSYGPNGHNWGSWSTTKTATCKSAGQQARKCSSCGSTETQSTGTSSHDWVSYTVDATCTSGGRVTTKCTVCGTASTSYTAALGHKRAPGGFCSRCGAEM